MLDEVVNQDLGTLLGEYLPSKFRKLHVPRVSTGLWSQVGAGGRARKPIQHTRLYDVSAHLCLHCMAGVIYKDMHAPSLIRVAEQTKQSNLTILSHTPCVLAFHVPARKMHLPWTQKAFVQNAALFHFVIFDLVGGETNVMPRARE